MLQESLKNLTVDEIIKKSSLSSDGGICTVTYRLRQCGAVYGEPYAVRRHEETDNNGISITNS